MVYFKHDPSLRLSRSKRVANVLWNTEPAISAFREFTYQNKERNETIRVPLNATPLVIEGVGLLVCSDDGFVRFVSLALDVVFWEVRLAASIYSSPIYLADSKTMIVCSTGGTVIALSIKGQVLWRTVFDFPIYAGVVRAGNSLYVPAFNFQIHCIACDTGALTFSIDLPRPRSLSVFGLAAFRDPYATPCVIRDRIVAACGEHVVCFYITGELLWQARFSASIRSSLACCEKLDIVIVATVDGRLRLIKGSTGEVLRVFTCGAKFVHSPAISGKVACLGDESGRVYGIDLSSREIIWIYEVGAALGYSSVTLAPSGDFVFLSNRGNALCVSRSRGEFLWESSQNLQLDAHEREMHTTPILTYQGQMYCGSYTGYLYRFDFLSADDNGND